MNAIPEEWIKKYVDTLTDTAASLPVGPFRDAVAMRAEHAMDLVKAWRESAAVQPPDVDDGGPYFGTHEPDKSPARDE